MYSLKISSRKEGALESKIAITLSGFLLVEQFPQHVCKRIGGVRRQAFGVGEVRGRVIGAIEIRMTVDEKDAFHSHLRPEFRVTCSA